MTQLKTGEWQMINGEWLRLVQTNAVTILVQNQKGEQFHINKKDIQMSDTSEALRKTPVMHIVDVEVKHVPEHYAIRINGESIDKYSDEELFSCIQAIEVEILKLDEIISKPLALARLLDSKRASINHICAWMNARK